ncbi:acyl-CoA carboxylase subunit epsilon [Nocardia sp. CNY236]|uniref:acyl-CoA carboxylase subunit epsilon n=1 Tax=Nocardia sp. CNY236 TaxID=1169152 RepID=UPI00040282AA|nr:acyl-CoA carboxylase subunit epsilon [Nocardia sp. CNY236]
MTTVAEDALSTVELDLAVDAAADASGTAAGTDASAARQPTEATAQPMFRVVKGSPTDEDLAALVCVLSATAGCGAPNDPPAPRDLWGRPSTLHRGVSPFSPYAFSHVSQPHE